MSSGGSQPHVRALGRSAARGGAVTLAGQGLRIGIQITSIILLARLLGPADYGFVAMVTAVVGIADLIQDFGLSRAAIQAPSITKGQRDNLFWLNLAFGCAAGLIVFLAAPLVALLYGEPALAEITRWLAIPFVFGGMAAQFRAGLLRDLRFGISAVIDVVGPFLGLVVAVAIAAAEGSYWALVAQQVVASGVMALGAIVAARWWPGLPRRHESVRTFVSYGLHFLGAQTLTYLSMNVDTVVVGARFGASAAGLYNRAFQMMMLPIRQLTWPAAKVAMPVLSRLQDDEEQFSRFLVRGQAILLNAMVPFMALAAALAGPVVQIVLGPTWVDVVPVFAVLAVGGIFQAAGYAPNWVFMSTGNTRAQLQFALVSRPLVVVGVLVGSTWGVIGVAAAYSAMMALIWPASLWWVGRVTGISVRPWFVSGARTVVAHSAAAAGAGLAAAQVGQDHPWLAILLGGVVMTLILGLELVLWPAFRHDLRELVRTRKLLGRSRRDAVSVGTEG